MARPTVITPSVLQKLEYSFKRGYSNAEACLHAEISERTLYDYLKDHEGFSQKCSILKNNMLLKAKEIVNDRIEAKDLDTAKWYLERKNKDEFSLRTDLKHQGDPENPLNTTITVEFTKSYDKTQERISDILENTPKK
jgi:hypothetical protein